MGASVVNHRFLPNRPTFEENKNRRMTFDRLHITAEIPSRNSYGMLEKWCLTLDCLIFTASLA